MKVKKTIATVIYHVFIAGLGLIMIYPVLWMISGSLKNNPEILSGSLSLIPPEWRWENFATGWRGFGHVTFTTYFKNSLIIPIVAPLERCLVPQLLLTRLQDVSIGDVS